MDPYREAIEDRIRELHKYRRWGLRYAATYRWNDLMDDYRREAGRLNRIRNKARKAKVPA